MGLLWGFMFKFIKLQDESNKYDTTKVIVVSEAITLPQILEDFQDFLRGSGFVFDGNLEIISPDEADENFE